jgi:hypothetical protein
MNNVTDGLPAATGCSGLVIHAPREAQTQSNYGAAEVQHRRSDGAVDALLRVEVERATDDDNGAVVDLPAVAGALAALDIALAEHGAPDPERTAAWLCALGAGGRA